MKRKMSAGLTSATIPIFVSDTSSTTGAGLSGLTSGSSGLVCEYRRQGQSAWTAVTLSAGTLGTWSSGGFVADGALAGAYEVGVPDAALASGARWVAVRLRGATNMLACLVEIELDAINYQDAVRFGLTALPNATVSGVGGLLTAPTTANTGLADVTRLLGTAWLTPATAGTPDVNAKLWNGLTTVALPLVPTTAGRTLDVSVGGEAGVDWANVGSPTTTLALTNTTISASQVAASVTAGVSVGTGGIVAGSFAAGAIDAGAIATDAIGSAEISAAAVTKIQNGLATPTNITAASGVTLAAVTHTGATIPTVTTTGTTTNLTNLPAITANWLTAAGLASDAVAEIQSGLATPTNITAATGVVLSSGGVDAIWAKAMTELSAVPGVTASVLSALTWVFELARNKVTQTATTQTVLKDDGTTTLATSTVSDDGTTFTRGKFS